MTASAGTELPEDQPDQADFDASASLLAMLGACYVRLGAQASQLEAIRRVLITEMAQRDDSPLTCTASFVDVGELT